MSGTYEPPLTKIGSPIRLGEEKYLATGVIGYAVEKNGEIWIPMIIAEDQGSGDTGRFLDSLSPRCVIPNVTSPRLAKMLDRRGFSYIPSEDVWRRIEQKGSAE